MGQPATSPGLDCGADGLVVLMAVPGIVLFEGCVMVTRRRGRTEQPDRSFIKRQYVGTAAVGKTP